jgi:hypothetical protein
MRPRPPLPSLAAHRGALATGSLGRARRSPLARGALAGLAMMAATGCSNVSSYAVPTAGPTPQPRVGAVAVFASRPPTEGRELGIIEAKGQHGESSIAVLFPELVRRAQELGGNAVVIDSVAGRYELVESWSNQTTMFPCGFRSACSQWNTYPTVHEEMSVVLRGRAWLLPEPGNTPREIAAPPAGSP